MGNFYGSLLAGVLLLGFIMGFFTAKIYDKFTGGEEKIKTQETCPELPCPDDTEVVFRISNDGSFAGMYCVPKKESK